MCYGRAAFGRMQKWWHKQNECVPLRSTSSFFGSLIFSLVWLKPRHMTELSINHYNETAIGHSAKAPTEDVNDAGRGYGGTVLWKIPSGRPFVVWHVPCSWIRSWSGSFRGQADAFSSSHVLWAAHNTHGPSVGPMSLKCAVSMGRGEVLNIQGWLC